MRLELGVKPVLATLLLLEYGSNELYVGSWGPRDTHHLIPLEEDHSTALVACREITPGMIELHRRNDIG